MILNLPSLEREISIVPGYATVLEIENHILFSRVCESIVSEGGAFSKEPYSLWREDGTEVNPRDAFIFVLSPLQLPWDNRLIAGKMHDRIQALIEEDDKAREKFERFGRLLFSSILETEYSMHASYAFKVEWDLKKCLRTFSFGPEEWPSETLLDNVIQFIDFYSDMRPGKPLLFVNLKQFFSHSEIESLYSHLFFQKTPVLFLESQVDSLCFTYERKTTVDQYFLEF